MSEVEKSRTATEFQSITDGPTTDTVENMEDDVFSKDESCNQRNDSGDKSEATTSNTHTSLPVVKRRGRPKGKCSSLGSLGSKSSKKLPNNSKYPCGVCSKNVTFSVYSVQCNKCCFWIHLKCSKLQSVDEWNKNYICPKCNNITEKNPETTQSISAPKSSGFRILSYVSQNKSNPTIISDTGNDDNRNNVKRKRGDEYAKDKKLSTD